MSVDGKDITSTGAVSSISDDRKKFIYVYSTPNVGQIDIELLNKEPFDTKVVDGKIVEDLLVIVDDLSIDSVNLTSKLNKISVYRGDGNVYQSHGYITFKGVMCIKIHSNILYTNWLGGLI